MKNLFESKQAKKIVIAVGSFIAVILVIVFSLYLTGVDLNPFSEAGLTKNLVARIEGGVLDTVTKTQLETYKVRIYNKNGVQLRGPFTINAIYCPPNISRNSTNVKKVDASTLNSKMTFCGSYSASANSRLDSNGTFIGDLGKIASESSKALPIGNYYMAFNNSSGFSNEVIVKIVKLNMSDYWSFDTDSYSVFNGVNNEVKDASGKPITGTVYTDYVAKEKICEKETAGSIAWRIAGSNKYMYWNPDFRTDDSQNLIDLTRPVTSKLTTQQRETSFFNLSFNFSKMKLGDGREYIGSNYWSSFLTTGGDSAKHTSYSPALEESFNPNKRYDLTFITSPVDQTKTFFPDGNMLFFPMTLDLNDEFDINSTSFFPATPGDDSCSKLFRESPVPTTNRAMHVINFFAHEYKGIDGKQPSTYGVVISINEIYPDMPATDAPGDRPATECKIIADFWNKKCPTSIREDYYTNKGVGLTGIIKDQYGYTRYESRKVFTKCSDDPDCARKGPIQNPAFSMSLSKSGKKVAGRSLNTVMTSLFPSSSATLKSPPIKVTRQAINSSNLSANYTITVDQNDPILVNTEAFQIILDEKSGWSATSCPGNYSTTTKGGIRLMFNNKTWTLANATFGMTTNSSTLYYYSPAVTGKNVCNAANSYCWYQNKTNAGYTTDGGIKVSNITSQKSGNLVVINFTVESNIDVSRLNAYFFYQTNGTTPARQNNNRITQTHEFNSNGIKSCGAQLFNQLRIN